MSAITRTGSGLFQITCPICHVHARAAVQAALIRWWNDHRLEHQDAAA